MKPNELKLNHLCINEIYLISNNKEDKQILEKINDSLITVIEPVNTKSVGISSIYIKERQKLDKLLSYLICLRLAIEKEVDCIAIFEDNLIPIDNFQKEYVNFYKDIPSNWSFLLLEWRNTNLKRHNITDNYGIPFTGLLSNAFVISGIDNIIQIYNRIKILDKSFEEMLFDLDPIIPMYLPIPSLFKSTVESYNSIEKKINDYSLIK